MSTYDIFKDIIKLAKKADNLELQEGILEVKGKMLELEESNQHLKKEVSQLEEKLSFKEKLVFDKGTYWIPQDSMSKDNSDTPVCQPCYDATKTVFRLILREKTNGEIYVRCKNCKNYHTIKEGRPFQQPIINSYGN